MHNFGDILQYVSDFERGQLQWRFGSDQSVWRDGDWNGFVRIAVAGLLDVRKRRGKYDILLAFSGIDAERRLEYREPSGPGLRHARFAGFRVGRVAS